MCLRLMFCLLGVLVLSLPGFVSAQDVATNPEIDFAKNKYMIAKTTVEVNEKCSLLTKLADRAAYYSADHYGDFLRNHDEGAFVSSVNQQASAAVRNSPCGQLSSDPQVRAILQNTSYLTGEYLYAIALSEVRSCGTYNEETIAKLMFQAKQSAESATQRQDFQYIKPVAEERGKRLAELCENYVTNNQLFLVQSGIGGAFVYAMEAIQ